MMHLTIQQLVAQTDGELAGPSLKLVEKHIAECETCWHEMEQLAELDALLASVVSIDPGDAFFDELAANIEAEISGKKKPAPRVAAPPPAPPPATARPEPEAASPPFEPEPVMLEPAAASLPPVPTRFDSFDLPRDVEPTFVTTEPIGAWTPPAPTPDDPFADLVLPKRSSAAPARTPRPPEPRAVRPNPAPKPAPKPVATPAGPAPPRVQAAPAAPPEGQRKLPLAPILIGVGAFIAGIALAVVLTIRLLGHGGIAGSRPEGSVPPAVQPESAPPVTASPEPAFEPVPEPEAPPTVQVEAPPAQIPAPAAAALPRPPAPQAPRGTRPRTQPHAPVAGSIPGRDPASESPSTTVIPVQVIRTETAAPATPATPAPEPAAPAPQAELGILCGLVRDTEGRPVARAQVMMADVGVVVLTDRAGRFCLTAPAGERTLSVVALGFSPSRRLVSLGKRTPELNVTLKSAAPFPTPR